jgi:hypothetical protein
MNMMISYQELVRTFPNEAEVILPGKIKHRDRHRAVLLSAIFQRTGKPGTVYQFNDGFIVGSREKVDLSRFSTSAITEGTYSLTSTPTTSGKALRFTHRAR